MPLRRLTRFSASSWRRRRPSSSARSRRSTRSSATTSCCGRSSPTSSPRSPRPSAPRAAPCCSSPPASRWPRRPAPLEVADDPCFAYLSSTGLLARSSTDEPPTGDGGARQPRRHRLGRAHDRPRRDRRAHLAGPRRHASSVLDLPALPASANHPHLQGGLPFDLVRSLEAGERVLALCRAARRRSRARARHPPGRREAGQPRGARPATSGR